jgi:SAM-dependent methyltransferase
MRAALVMALAADPRLEVGAGTAENTGLDDASIDLIVAAQAFHWFERDRTRREFRRILRPSGAVALVWNSRLEEATPFLKAYENLLQRWATDYRQINHRNVDLARIAPFFAPGNVERHAFPSEQVFDFDGLRGRLLSSSYAPAAGHPGHAPMLAELRSIFDTHQENDRVRFLYETEVYLGRF